MEPTLERWIGNICALQFPFHIRLNNFSSHPPGSIYVRVQDQHPFLSLVDKMKFLDGFIQSNDCPRVQFASRAFISLADGLPEPVFEQAEKYYSGRTFSSSFLLSKLVLLKKNDADTDYRLIQAFRLSCQPD